MPQSFTELNSVLEPERASVSLSTWQSAVTSRGFFELGDGAYYCRWSVHSQRRGVVMWVPPPSMISLHQLFCHRPLVIRPARQKGDEPGVSLVFTASAHGDQSGITVASFLRWEVTVQGVQRITTRFVTRLSLDLSRLFSKPACRAVSIMVSSLPQPDGIDGFSARRKSWIMPSEHLPYRIMLGTLPPITSSNTTSVSVSWK